MALKIKWNDDRIRGAVTALLLISRARLAQGQTTDLIRGALDEYRADPDGYKRAHPRRDLAEARTVGPLKDVRHVVYYHKLVAEVERVLTRLEKNKRQFNSLAELDNFLVSTLTTFG